MSGGPNDQVLPGVRPPLDPPADIASLFAVERQHLQDLLRDKVDDPDWGRSSPCPGWTVLDLCAHLVGGDLGLLARHRDEYFGTPPPAGVPESAFIEWIDDLQDGWVRAARRLSPRLVVELLTWTTPSLVEVFARQDPRQRTASVSWAGPDPVPIWLDQVRELSEYWIHRQQLLQALREPSELAPTLVGPILDGFRWAYPYRLAALPGEHGDGVVIAISGPVDVTWILEAGPGGWAFTSGPVARERMVAELKMTTEQAWRLLSNNLAPAGQQELEVRGREDLVAALLKTRAIIGAPN